MAVNNVPTWRWRPGEPRLQPLVMAARCSCQRAERADPLAKLTLGRPATHQSRFGPAEGVGTIEFRGYNKSCRLDHRGGRRTAVALWCSQCHCQPRVRVTTLLAGMADTYTQLLGGRAAIYDRGIVALAQSARAPAGFCEDAAAFDASRPYSPSPQQTEWLGALVGGPAISSYVATLDCYRAAIAAGSFAALGDAASRLAGAIGKFLRIYVTAMRLGLPDFVRTPTMTPSVLVSRDGGVRLGPMPRKIVLLCGTSPLRYAVAGLARPGVLRRVDGEPAAPNVAKQARSWLENIITNCEEAHLSLTTVANDRRLVDLLITGSPPSQGVAFKARPVILAFLFDAYGRPDLAYRAEWIDAQVRQRIKSTRPD